jgi:Ankyrin repeats (3 copies)
VALGSTADVVRCLEKTAALDDRDRFSRTALHLAVVLGDLAKVQTLHDRGAKLDEEQSCKTSPLMASVTKGNAQMTRWLLEHGANVETLDKAGRTALMFAAQFGEAECVRMLLEAGARRDCRDKRGSTAKSLARNESVLRLLTKPGEDLSDISEELKRTLIGLPRNSPAMINVSKSEYRAGREREFGRRNPETMPIPFWQEMIRTGFSAYGARKQFEDQTRSGPRVWCFSRYGMSFTELPDGRFVQIAGEHEDYYDPDFCIYNDVVIHERSGKFQIMGYPEEIFPPTDFHSATHVDGNIYIIGSLGYQGARRFGTTPVYRLDCHTWQIHAIETTGENPGWISKHRASFDGLRNVIVAEGKIAQWTDGKEQYVENKAQFRLDLKEMHWSRL